MLAPITDNPLAIKLEELQAKIKLQESIIKQQVMDMNRVLMELEFISRDDVLGELTSALAHEINQPLTAIRAYAQSCLIRAQQKTDLKEFLFPLEQITMLTTYVSSVTQHMKHFIGPSNLHLELTDLNDLIKKTTTFLYYDTNVQIISIQFKLLADLPQIQVDKLKIMQVLLNLGQNSIDAFQSYYVSKPLLCIETELQENQIIVHFRDNGPGIPAELADKILTPYFTTKKEGTGLGLYISRNFIKAHGGELAFNITHGEGAWFYFTLPIKHTQKKRAAELPI
jgi:two-component system sensor kinase FixL